MAKEIEVKLFVWEAFDGAQFKNQQEAEDYEDRIKNSRRPCPTCNGEKKVCTDQTVGAEVWEDCQVCGGKGFQNKQEVWQ